MSKGLQEATPHSEGVVMSLFLWWFRPSNAVALCCSNLRRDLCQDLYACQDQMGISAISEFATIQKVTQ